MATHRPQAPRVSATGWRMPASLAVADTSINTPSRRASAPSFALPVPSLVATLPLSGAEVDAPDESGPAGTVPAGPRAFVPAVAPPLRASVAQAVVLS